MKFVGGWVFFPLVLFLERELHFVLGVHKHLVFRSVFSAE